MRLRGHADVRELLDHLVAIFGFFGAIKDAQVHANARMRLRAQVYVRELLDHLVAIFGLLGAILGHLGAILGPSWGHHGARWAIYMVHDDIKLSQGDAGGGFQSMTSHKK